MSYVDFATDVLGAVARGPFWDEVRNPTQVTLSPFGAGSTVYGNILTGTPSGVARVVIQGGNYWVVTYESNANAWDAGQDGSSPPTVTVYFSNGSKQVFPKLQSVSIRGGALRRGVAVSSAKVAPSLFRKAGRSRPVSKVHHVVGAFDLGLIQHDLDAIKSMSVAQAGVLIKYGEQVIDAAIKGAGSLPGAAARANVKAKLDWHQNALSKLFDPSAPYGAADDAKLWTRQAFIEWNAINEGKQYAEANWASMIEEIKNRAVKAIEKPGQVMDAVSKVPWWAWMLGGVAVLGVGAVVVVPVARRVLR